jgi:hypothetical protein
MTRPQLLRFLAVVVIALASGCSGRVPSLVALRPIISLERLSPEAAQKELKRGPLPSGPQSTPPPGVIANEWQPIGVVSGKSFYAVITGGLPQRIWLYDAKWRQLGEVRPPRGLMDDSNLLVEAQWDPEGRWLAVHFRVRRGLPRVAAVVVAPPTLRAVAEIRADHSDWDWMAWAGERLLVGYCDVPARRNVVWELTPAGGRVRSVYGESVAGWNRITAACVSPDGDYLAFTRARETGPNGHEDFTVWLLDLRTFVSTQLTRESQGNSMHSVLHWEGPRTLLLWRGGEVYRATLDLPLDAPNVVGHPPGDQSASAGARRGGGRGK